MPSDAHRTLGIRAFQSILCSLLAIALANCAVIHLTRTAIRDRRGVVRQAPGTVDDASHLNQTPVREIVDVVTDDTQAIMQIRRALERARTASVHISIAGFRHSMGGQTIAPDGIVLNMLQHNHIALDGDVLTVQSGAVWKDVVESLDQHGRSIAVMQSDSPFSIGGSLSVNCHGWQHLHEPIASTVLAMTVMTPTGEVIHCSRTDHRALFTHVLGGYGMFGVILDAAIQTVPNERYREVHTACDVHSYETVFDEKVRERPLVGMAYGRVSVAPASFLRETILTTYEREPGPLPKLGELQSSRMERLVFRGSVDSDYGKNLRWRLENWASRSSRARHVSRNQVLHQSIEDYIARDTASTDILHEYFVPRGTLSAFIDRVRPLLLQPDHPDLLNITIRDVKKDNTTALAYAREDVFSVVMFFNQKHTTQGEAAMQRTTRELIDVAVSLGGTYYLPYRLHATTDQFDRAYPQGRAFFEEKRRVDPEEILSSLWYEQYGKGRR
jgi:FAD/FMN-containing dehydrogenase